MDGFGQGAPYGNAIDAAATPNLDSYLAQYPHTLIDASGMAVGLPDGQMGNSEVGHTNIGAGRVVYQELTRITKAAQDGELAKNPAFIAAFENCKSHDGSALHLIGLLSDGGVHSHNTHLYELVKTAKAAGVSDIFIHCLMDGRDVPPMSGKGYIEELRRELEKIGAGKIATVMGRYYAMDRDNRWERVKKAYCAMCFGSGIQNPDPVAAVAESYENGVTDEFILPIV